MDDRLVLLLYAGLADLLEELELELGDAAVVRGKELSEAVGTAES